MADRVKTILRHLDSSGPAVSFALCTQPTSALAVSAPQYHCTRDETILTPQQRDSYEKNGFLVVKNVVPKEALARYNRRFLEICQAKEKPMGIIVVRDVAMAKSDAAVLDEKSIIRIQDFSSDAALFDYCCLPEVLKYIKSIIGHNIMVVDNVLINKPPDLGTKTSRHPMHQDLHYFPFRPANRIVCAWTAMERVHRKNGCLVVVPGTHKGELLEHGYPEWEGGVNRFYHGIKNFDPTNSKYIHLEMDPGDTVFFHPLLHHGSGINTTNGFRKAILCHYGASECEYVDVSGGSQKNIAEEMMGLAEKRLGKEQADQMQYKDIWSMRAHLVSGEKITL